MKFKATLLSIFVVINFCNAQNNNNSESREELKKEFVVNEEFLNPKYFNDGYNKSLIDCNLMISTFILASKSLEDISTKTEDYEHFNCVNGDECIWKKFDYSYVNLSKIVSSDKDLDATTLASRSSGVTIVNGTKFLLFPKLLIKLQDAKKSANFEELQNWFKSPFASNKERKKSDLFETFKIIVDKLSIPQEKKESLKIYCEKLNEGRIKQNDGRLIRSDGQISNEYMYLLINELKFLPINMGDICALIESQHQKITFGDKKYRRDTEYSNDNRSDVFKNEGFLTKMILKSLLILYKTNCLINLDENTESQLFAAKYLYDQASIKDEKYINRIKNIPYYSNLTKLLFSGSDKSKEMDFLFNYRVLSLLKESGLKEINNLTYNNNETINIDFALKTIIKNELKERLIKLTVKSYNSCFMSKIGAYDNEKTLLSEGYDALHLNFLNSDFIEKDCEIKIINTGNDFKIEKAKISENSKKNQIKKYSELTDDEKLKFSDQELRTLMQNEAYEKSKNEARISSLKNIDNSLYFIFRNDAVIMNKTLIDFYKNYGDLNSIRNKEKINLISKYFYDNQTSSEDDSPQIDSIKNMLVIFMSSISGDTMNVPEGSSMQFVKQMIDWSNQTHNNFYAAKNFLAKKAIGKYKSILDQLSSENDEIALKEAKEKFDNIYLSNMNDINPAKTSFGGDCRYSTSGFESGDGELTISKGNTFLLYGDITSSLGGSIEAGCTGKIVKSENEGYILESNSGNYRLEFVQGKCKKIYMELIGLGKNSKISFLLNWK
jgi:hypothetical protein